MNSIKSKRDRFSKKLNNIISKLAGLPDGWADCSENKAFSKFFLNSVKSALNHLFLEILTFNKEIFFPVIAPMEVNSIDVHWKNDYFQLLINIKETIEKSNVELYGHRSDSSDEIKWHGNLAILRGVILGWFLTKL